jgi:hypothetical protein
MTRKEELEKIIGEATEELHAIDEREIAKEALPFVGKFFKYRNSYGTGKKWWLYLKVLSYNERNFNTLQFQLMGDGKIEIENRDWTHANSLIRGDSGYIEIEAKEFRQGWGEITNAIEKTKEQL